MNDLFIRACRRQPVERVPIWLMRQAGRSLPEYRALRERFDFETLLRTPELATRVTLQPVERLGVDAAIVFSDILVAAEALGVAVRFDPAPRIDAPVRQASDVERLSAADPETSVPYLFETLRQLSAELAGRVPLIGFAAAPFTLATYLIEGQGPRGFERVKGLLYSDPRTAQRLLGRIAATTERYLAAQIAAGAQVIQLFDTWAGVLDREDYREFALRWAREVLERLAGTGVPRIYFALDAAHLLPDVANCGADVVGLDWRVDLAAASAALGRRFVLQGNLDPCALFAPQADLARRARAVLDAGRAAPGHVFNLGHGVLPDTPLDNLEALVRLVQTETLRPEAAR